MEFPLSLGNCLPYIANLQQGLATLVKGDGVSCAPFMGTAGCYMTESRRKNSRPWLLWPVLSALLALATPDRKSTRLNSSHVRISYAVFCLKKKITRASVLQ